MIAFAFLIAVSLACCALAPDSERHDGFDRIEDARRAHIG